MQFWSGGSETCAGYGETRPHLVSLYAGACPRGYVLTVHALTLRFAHPRLVQGTKIVSNQICYNLLWRGIEDEVVPFCIENGIAILPWSPMGQGLLTGKVLSADEVQPGRQRSRLFSSKRPQQRHGEPGA